MGQNKRNMQEHGSRRRQLAGLLLWLLLLTVLAGCGGAKKQQEQKQQDQKKAQAQADSYIDVTALSDAPEEDFDKYATQEAADGTDGQQEALTDGQTQTKEAVQDMGSEESGQTQEPASSAGAGNGEETQPPEHSDASPAADTAAEQKQVEDADGQPETAGSSCTLLVECAALLQNMDKLPEAKRELVPADGILYAKAAVAIEDGDTAFDILQREMQNNRIQMEYNYTPLYESNYIEGIGNLYEFDCGELSGWMYCINGAYLNYGCSQYVVQPGDSIEFHYTCDLGKDLGQGQ